MSSNHQSVALRTIDIELKAIEALRSRIDEGFDRACECLLACRGRIVVTGMGKSNHIGNKLAATLASTGSPSFFVHPGEASHGDLGMITREDVVIAISSSGSSAEITTLLPLLKRLGIPLVAMTGKADSPLGQAADHIIDISVSQEACPLGLAPTSSTTATLVMGDALAIALLEARGFTAEDFAFSHPGGALGRKLLVKVGDLMHSGDALPRVKADTPLPSALIEMTAKGMGITTVLDEAGKLIGVFTDGDLRRTVDHNHTIDNATIGDNMTKNPTTVGRDMLAAEALAIMENKKITVLVVTENDSVIGVLQMYDILRAGVV